MKRRKLPPLPSACSECRPFEGLWRMDQNGGMERCTCPRGQILSDATAMKRRRRKPAFDGKAAAVGNN